MVVECFGSGSSVVAECWGSGRVVTSTNKYFQTRQGVLPRLLSGFEGFPLSTAYTKLPLRVSVNKCAWCPVIDWLPIQVVFLSHPKHAWLLCENTELEKVSE